MTIERVTHLRWPRVPVDYSRNVQSRWEAIKALYVLQRNRERALFRAPSCEVGP